MLADAFLNRLLAVVEANPDLLHEHRFPEDASVETRPSAVLVPVVDYGDHASILLTVRTADLPDHPGQVCFPGGTQEEGETLEETAIRECAEELGLTEDQVEIVACSRARVTGTGFHITPFVGRLQGPLKLTPDATEVAEVFEVPLALVCDVSAYVEQQMMFDGVPRTHDKLPFEDYHIWGATAGILRDMCNMVTTKDTE